MPHLILKNKLYLSFFYYKFKFQTILKVQFRFELEYFSFIYNKCTTDTLIDQTILDFFLLSQSKRS